MNADVCRWTRFCLRCQRANVTHHTITSPGTFRTPNARFDHVHTNLVGSLLTSQGCTYLLTYTDSMAKALPIQNSSSGTVAQAFRSGWISYFIQCTLNHHKWPRWTIRIITMETPHEFPGYSINLDNTVPPNSQSPGRTFSPAVERSHKVFIRYYSVNQSISSYPGICTTIKPIKQDCHCSAAELVYGTTLRLPGDCFNSTPTSS